SWRSSTRAGARDRVTRRANRNTDRRSLLAGANGGADFETTRAYPAGIATSDRQSWLFGRLVSAPGSPSGDRGLCERRQRHATERADHDDEQRRRAPYGEEHEAGERDGEIAGCADRTGPDRVVESRAEQADDGSVDAAHHGLRAGAAAEALPERQRAEQDEHAGQKNAGEPQSCAGDAMRRGAYHGAQIGREGEERAGYRLSRAVAGEKPIVAHPAGRDEGLAQQRQNDMPAAEHQCAGTIKGIKERDAGGAGQAAQDGEAREQKEKD